MFTEQSPPLDPPITVIGLGSNLGDRRATIEAAIDAIAKPRAWRWWLFDVGRPTRRRPPTRLQRRGRGRNRAPLDRLMADLLEIKRASTARGREECAAPLDLDLLWVEG
jgi:7,8-dihydro-6-hydroxymethylpterin-pyrophosphokinase